MIDVAQVSLLLTLNSFHKFFCSFRSWLWKSKFWPSRTWAGIFSQERVIVNQPLNIFAKKLHHRYSSGLWIRLWFKVNLYSKIKCIRLFCICNFQMNFFYFASLFIGFSPASVPYEPLVLLFLPHEQFEVSRKIQKVWTKKESDQGNDMIIADSC